MPAAKPGAKILRGSVVGDLRATLEETRSLLSDRDEQLRKSRLREAELMTALERERQCVSRAERRIESLERALGVADPQGVFQFQRTSTRRTTNWKRVHRSLRRRSMSTF